MSCFAWQTVQNLKLLYNNNKQRKAENVHRGKATKIQLLSRCFIKCHTLTHTHRYIYSALPVCYLQGQYVLWVISQPYMHTQRCVLDSHIDSSRCCSPARAADTVAGTVSGGSRLHMTVDLGGLSAGRLVGTEASSSSTSSGGGGGSSRQFNALIVTASLCTGLDRNVFGRLCIQITSFICVSNLELSEVLKKRMV